MPGHPARTHQKGLIHRDIKPQNVLVSLEDGKPVPRVIDFGVAKAIDRRLTASSLATGQDQIVGTPTYMSPEQAGTNGQDIDTRSDIYSLGVLLYELLVGASPFDPEALREAGLDEIRRMIREDEPAKPSRRVGAACKKTTDLRQLQRELRGDLDWITMKALEKDRVRRYASASELAADIERHLNHEPVLAGPPSRVYRLRKFVRRHRAGSIAFAIVLAGVVVGIAGILRGRSIAQEKQRDAETQAAIAREVNSYWIDIIVRLDLRKAQGDVLTVRQMVDEVASRIQKEFADRPAKHPQTLTVMSNLAELLKARGRLGEAEKLFRSTLETSRRAVGDDALKTALLMNGLAGVLLRTGELDEAETLYRNALQIRQRKLSEEHRDTLISLANLGNLLRAREKWDEAEPVLRKALELLRRTRGEEARDTRATMNNLAMLLKARGELDEAERLDREVLRIERRVLSEDHPDTLVSMNNLAALLLARDKVDEAEPLFRRALAAQRRVLGESHPSTLNTMDNLAVILMRRRKLDEAEALFRKVLEACDAKPGELRMQAPRTMNNLAILLQELRRFAEAEALLRKTIKAKRRLYGRETADTLVTMFNLASLFTSQGKLDDAEKLYRRVLKSQRRVLTKEHPDLLASMSSLGSLLRIRRPDEAETLLRGALAAQRRTIGPDHPDAVATMHNFAGLLSVRGKFEEAENLARQAVLAGERTLPAGHWQLATYRVNWGVCLAKLKRYDEAETNLLRSYDQLAAKFEPEHVRTLKVIQALVNLYEAWNKPDKAAAYRSRIPTHDPSKNRK